ncbi:MAG: hypothetical protein LBV06_07920 [Propionibacteriaceae bacterium]|jgi:hypothetical protein|nr:hypothetical protein [Propionibacteriaceae bacterium]
MTHIPRDLEDRIASCLAHHEKRVARLLLQKIKRTETVLEMCPVSNLTIAGLSDFSRHPFWPLTKDPEVHVSISSDNPLIFGGFSHNDIDSLRSSWNHHNKAVRKRIDRCWHCLPSNSPITAAMARQVSAIAKESIAMLTDATINHELGLSY